jgi:hypothetical protein
VSTPFGEYGNGYGPHGKRRPRIEHIEHVAYIAVMTSPSVDPKCNDKCKSLSQYCKRGELVGGVSARRPRHTLNWEGVSADRAGNKLKTSMISELALPDLVLH